MTPIHTFHGNTITSRRDQLAIEEPLEIRITYGPLTNRSRHTLAVTMRTPGHDDDLAIGYLISEGLLTDPDDIVAVTSLDVNAIRIDLKPHVHVNLARLTRTGFVSSSCGVCGRTVVDTLETVCEPIRDSARVSAAVIHDLPRRLRAGPIALRHDWRTTRGGIIRPCGQLVDDSRRHRPPTTQRTNYSAPSPRSTLAVE